MRHAAPNRSAKRGRTDGKYITRSSQERGFQLETSTAPDGRPYLG